MVPVMMSGGIVVVGATVLVVVGGGIDVLSGVGTIVEGLSPSAAQPARRVIATAGTTLIT
jgi:hypothetical protein